MKHLDKINKDFNKGVYDIAELDKKPEILVLDQLLNKPEYEEYTVSGLKQLVAENEKERDLWKANRQTNVNKLIDQFKEDLAQAIVKDTKLSKKKALTIVNHYFGLHGFTLPTIVGIKDWVQLYNKL